MKKTSLDDKGGLFKNLFPDYVGHRCRRLLQTVSSFVIADQDPEHPRSVVHTVRNIVEGRMRMESLGSLSSHCMHLIQWLLANDAAQRPSLEEISQHPWLAAMAKQQV